MNQNLMSRKQQLFRLYSGYSALLKNAQQHRAFIIAHANSLTPEKYQILLKNVNADIAFARARLDSLIPAIPVQMEAKPVQVMHLEACTQRQESQRQMKQAAFTPHGSQAQHAQEVQMVSEEKTAPSLQTSIIMEPSPVPSEAQSGALPDEQSGSVGWVIAGIASIVGFSIGAPLFIKWINKDPQRNLARVREILNAFKNA